MTSLANVLNPNAGKRSRARRLKMLDAWRTERIVPLALRPISRRTFPDLPGWNYEIICARMDAARAHRRRPWWQRDITESIINGRGIRMLGAREIHRRSLIAYAAMRATVMQALCGSVAIEIDRSFSEEERIRRILKTDMADALGYAFSSRKSRT